jgi:single-strand DNA-binding protein
MFDNVVRLIGFVGSDAELKTTKAQREYTVLSLATTASWKDKNGDGYIRRTEWHRLVAWGNLSTFAATLKNGAHVSVEGELRYREFLPKNRRSRRTAITKFASPRFISRKSPSSTVLRSAIPTLPCPSLGRKPRTLPSRERPARSILEGWLRSCLGALRVPIFCQFLVAVLLRCQAAMSQNSRLCTTMADTTRNSTPTDRLARMPNQGKCSESR